MTKNGRMLLIAWLGLMSVSAEAQPPPDLSELPVSMVAHRGLSSGFPENTLVAFQRSMALGVDGIEIDLRSTADGEIVVLHDDTVDRTTDGSGAVRTLTLEQVKALDAGSYLDPSFAAERVPTFEEVLALTRNSELELVLDVKVHGPAVRRRIMHQTERHGAVSSVIIGVRRPEDVQAWRYLNPTVRLLAFPRDVAEIEAFARAGVDAIRLWPKWILGAEDRQHCAIGVEMLRWLGLHEAKSSSSCLVRRVHAMNKQVWVTAGDAPREQLLSLIQLQVNGILTDLPEVLITATGPRAISRRSHSLR